MLATMHRAANGHRTGTSTKSKQFARCPRARRSSRMLSLVMTPTPPAAPSSPSPGRKFSRFGSFGRQGDCRHLRGSWLFPSCASEEHKQRAAEGGTRSGIPVTFSTSSFGTRILVLKTDGYGPSIKLAIWSPSANSHFSPQSLAQTLLASPPFIRLARRLRARDPNEHSFLHGYFGVRKPASLHSFWHRRMASPWGSSKRFQRGSKSAP